jgi:glycosyltransferase involved in cell wall biosynthesis
MKRPVTVAGFFPPPVTGQALATQRLADLLEAEISVQRLDMGVPARKGVHESRFDARLLAQNVGRIASWRADLRDGGPVLWASISPSRWGVWRDAAVSSTLWRPGQRVWGVVHHGVFARAFESPMRRVALRRTLSRLAGLVFVTEGLRQQCAPHVGRLPLHVIPNTLPPDAAASPAELAERRGARSEKMRVLFLSNLVPGKGYLDALEVASRLRAQDRLEHITFVGQWGDAADERAFDFKRRELELNACVRYLGPIYDGDAKRRTFLRHDVLLMPTHLAEVQPLVIAEALATGTPVVSTRMGGIPEQVALPEAQLVDPGDVEAMSRALSNLSDREAWLAASHAARARFDATSHPDRVRRLWLDLLDTA